MSITMVEDPGVVADTKTVVKVQRPTMYNVIFVNDDYTPMNFVVQLLEEIYFKNHDEALSIMLEVHHYDRSIAGTYSKEVALEKVEDTNKLAAINQYPLKVHAEPADNVDS